MKISELSAQSGITIATIKFYIREGLLEPGVHTAPNQARYDERHLERLRLIKVLREQGGLTLSVIKEAFQAAEQGEGSFLTRGIKARSGDPVDPEPLYSAEELQPAWGLLEKLAAKLDWTIDLSDPELVRVAQAYNAMDQAWPKGLWRPSLADYAGAADHLVTVELPDTWDPFAAPDQSMVQAVLGTFLMEPVILALRRAAHRQRGRKLIEQNRQPD